MEIEHDMAKINYFANISDFEEYPAGAAIF